ncbi:CD3072 family TudS-related putative desulfidase [Desulfospira joergensenii]|uniref:CD3072 family TudS-related putative desulfidase n=1 Tax=Desulfospira joergensenii TaxID=53329 RepID=UPI0003B49EDC|nr:CD3072 family TudS-related putative desulfidase [Desulfospira joergensenii]
MKRSKRLIFLAHCILNVNSKVQGIAEYKSAIKELICFLIDHDVAMIQLPCPETEILGLNRWGHVKDQFEYPFFQTQCRSLLEPIVGQVRMYHECGYRIEGVIGIDGSPSCGVHKTCRCPSWHGDFSNTKKTWTKIKQMEWENEPGIFIENFRSLLDDAGIHIPFFAVDEINGVETLDSLFDQLSLSLKK